MAFSTSLYKPLPRPTLILHFQQCEQSIMLTHRMKTTLSIEISGSFRSICTLMNGSLIDYLSSCIIVIFWYHNYFLCNLCISYGTKVLLENTYHTKVLLECTHHARVPYFPHTQNIRIIRRYFRVCVPNYGRLYS